jgi:hypothetical protein
MRHSNRWMVVAVITAAVGLAACTPVSTDYEREHEPAKAEPIEGTELSRVTVQEQAAERLGIRTASVLAGADGANLKVIPYAAVLYDADGATWTYTNPEPLTFIRDRITVDYIKGDKAFLSEGPASGTAVVTVGVPELFGIETGVGH